MFSSLKRITYRLPLNRTNYLSRNIMAGQQSTLLRFFANKNKSTAENTSSSLLLNQDKTEDSKKRPRSRAVSVSRSRSPSKSPNRSRSTSRTRSPSISNSPANKKVKNDIVSEDAIESHKKANELEDVKELLKLEPPTTTEKILPSKPIMYSALCDIFESLEKESSRLKNLAIASTFFKEVLDHTDNKNIEEKISDLVMVTYLMINRLGPDYEPGLELGLGETMLLKALGQGTGREMTQLRAEYKEVGDIGIVAQKSRSKQRVMFKPKRLTVLEVWKGLNEIAKTEGVNSQGRKAGVINRLLTACEGTEAKFLMRCLEGKLRINFGEKSVLISLAKAIVEWELTSKNKKVEPELVVQAEDQIKDAFCQLPNYEILIKMALNKSILNLMDHCGLKPGVPLKPMLAKPTKSIGEILDTLQGKRFTCEYKYDGERAQFHLLEDGSLRVYSRNSEDMTERYPDLVRVANELKEKNPDIKTLILDCECVAWDKEASKILPFQILSTRKRKDVQEKDIQVQVCLFAFDILYFNGESLIKKPLSERRDYLYNSLKVIEGKFQFATKMDTDNVEEITKFLDQSVHDACEGLMIKTLDGTDSFYEPSKRSRNWLKLKKDYLDGVGDSLDLVVIGGYIGKGKRTGWYGGFLLAGYNQDTGEYETVCKIGTGFSEELLQKLHDILKQTEISKPKASYVYDKNNSNAKPDVWFEPSVIFEVKVADLTTSPIYRCGATYIGDGEKGISLRFPRFIQIRDDKSTEDATSSEQIVEMYSSQANLQ